MQGQIGQTQIVYFLQAAVARNRLTMVLATLPSDI
jgi:hypothetical protein